MIPFVEVQFSGKTTLYGYLIPAGSAVPVPGQRVVVPTTIKSDGTVSLSIATIINVGATTNTSGLKPYVQAVDLAALAWAESETKRIESDLSVAGVAK